MKLAIAAQTGSPIAWRAWEGASGIDSPGARRWGGSARLRTEGGDTATLGLSGWYDAQMRGMSDALAEASGALSLAQAAQAALGDVQSAVERLQGLVRQASRSSATDEDREALQAEVAGLIDDVAGIAQQSLVDARRLGNPGFQLGEVRVTDNAHAWVAVQLHSARTNALGLDPTAVRAAYASQAVTADPLQPGDLSLNGIEVRPTFDEDDTVSTEEANASALAKAAAINASRDQHEVRAAAEPTEVSGSGPVQPGGLDTGALAINGVPMAATGVVFGDADSALRDAINARAGDTGVSAYLEDGGILVLRSEDGRNVRIALSGDGAAVTRLEAGLYTSSLSIRSETDVVVGGARPEAAGLQAGTVYALQMTAEMIADLDVSTAEGAATAVETIEEALEQVERQLGFATEVLGSYEASVLELARQALDTWAPRELPVGPHEARLAALQVRETLQRDLSDVALAHASLPPRMVLRLLA